MVKRFFLPQLRFHGIVSPAIFCVHAHIHTNKICFHLEKAVFGRAARCKQVEKWHWWKAN